MYLIIDGKKITDREALHDLFYEALELPEWYGRNLDALHDCLTDTDRELDIIFLHEEELYKNLSGYAFSLKRMLKEYAQVNSRCTLYSTEKM